MALLQFNNIYKSFAGEYILKNINFSVNEKDKIGLIGQNGAGKSTILKMILEEEGHDVSIEDNKFGNIVKKGNLNIAYLSQDFNLNEENTVFDELLSVFQDLMEEHKKIEELNQKLISDMENFDSIMEELSILNTKYEQAEGYSIEYKVKQILTGLNFPQEMYNQTILGLSGGQKSRVALGKILLQEPELLILDEPTNHLDLNAIEWLENFLKEYKKTFILISHDRYFLNNVVNKIFEIEEKKISIYNGNFDDYLLQKELYLSGALKAYEKEQEKIKKTEEYILKYKAGIKSKQARGREKILNRMEKMDNPISKLRKMKLKFEAGRLSTDKVLEIKNLSKAYDGKKILNNINMKIYRGDRVGIIGKNGVGKSTLLKIINKYEVPDSGEFKLGEKLDIAYYDQEHQNLNYKNKIIEELLNSYELSEEEARRMCGGFLFTGDDVEKSIKSLSGGEKARLSFMKLIKEQGNFLILDEPTNHLDIYSREILEEALEDYEGSILVVSHDRHFLEAIVNKIYMIDEEGATLFKGDYKEYQSKIAFSKNIKETNDDYEEQKKKKNRINGIEKQIENLQWEIEGKESYKEKLNKEYSEAGLKNAVSLLMELQSKIDSLDEEIYLLMENWEDLEKELISLK